jgi:hypothetical protein
MFKPRLVAAVLLVVFGLVLTLFFGLRALQSFRRMPPFPTRPPKPSETEVDTIRSWMSLKFISKAYGVPPDYLHTYLEIPSDIDESRFSLAALNQELGLGKSANGDPVLIDWVKFAITEYHANPGGSELREIQPSMSIQYIATVTGVPSEYIFENIGIPKADNQYKSLASISEEQNYEGGWETLVREIQDVLEMYKGN